MEKVYESKPVLTVIEGISKARDTLDSRPEVGGIAVEAHDSMGTRYSPPSPPDSYDSRDPDSGW